MVDDDLTREVALRMSDAEASILFDHLSKASASDAFATQAERIVVWRTICLLEKQLAFLLDPRWDAFVATARAKIEAEGAY